MSKMSVYCTAPRVIVPTPCKAVEGWVHVAVTFAKRDFLLYVDGKAIGVTELPVVPPPAKGPLVLGAGADGAEAMDGWLDDVRIYHRALTAQEVEALAAGTPVVADKGHDSDALRDEIEQAGCTPVIPHRKNRVKPSRNDGRRR